MLVVLDLNGTILDSTHHLRKGVSPHAKARRKFVYFRPHMKEFLEFLFSNPRIDVAIWTSNIADNAKAVVETAFTPEQQTRLKFIMSREHCKLGPNYTSFKHMSEIYKQGYDPKRVVIIDDSDNKVVPPDTPGWLQIETFEASQESLASDRALITLQMLIKTKEDTILGAVPTPKVLFGSKGNRIPV